MGWQNVDSIIEHSRLVLVDTAAKMKSVAALALIGSAAAFAPAQTGKASTQLNAVSSNYSLVGVCNRT